MARTHKVGIDYFSHDVDMCQDRKMKLVMAKYGLDGYGIYNRLLEDLYRDKGYYLEIDEDYNILFSNDNNLDINVYINILNDCINRGLFNKEIYEKYNVLTSERVQKNYAEATKRRSKVEFIKEYLILSDSFIDKNYSKSVDVDIKEINVNINSKKDNIGTQRKVKEIESIVKDKDKESESKEKVQKNKDLFEYWQNKKGLHEHQGIGKTIKKQLDKLTSSKVDDVKLAIDRYHKALIDESYYYNNVWTLDKFIKQGNGYKDWLNDGARWVDYSSRKEKKGNKSKNQFHEMQTGKDYTEDELNKQLGIKS